MNIVWRAHCPNCDTRWQRYETDFETGWGSCPKCGVLMNIVSTTVREKLDLSSGWHRIVVLPEETETAEDVVEREIQRWREGDESDMPTEDRRSGQAIGHIHLTIMDVMRAESQYADAVREREKQYADDMEKAHRRFADEIRELERSLKPKNKVSIRDNIRISFGWLAILLSLVGR